MRPDAEEKPTLQPRERRPGLGLQATGHQQDQSFRQAEKTATIRPVWSSSEKSRLKSLVLRTILLAPIWDE
jgi:hypothetical protein